MTSLTNIAPNYGQGELDLSAVGGAVMFAATGQFHTTFALANLDSTGATLELDASPDRGATWSDVTARSSQSGLSMGLFSTDGIYEAPTGLATFFRLRVVTAGAGTAVITLAGGKSATSIRIVEPVVELEPITIEAPPITVAQTVAPGSSVVLKTGPGKLASCYVTTGTTAGYLMLFDATAAPADGPVVPRDSLRCPALSTTSIDREFMTAEPFTNGIVAAFSSTGPFILTASATVFIKGITL